MGRAEMMSKVWAVVFLSLLLIEPSASLAIQMDSGSSQDSSGSIPGSGGDKNGTEGGSSPSGDPKPMQIGDGVALGLLLSGGSGSSGTRMKSSGGGCEKKAEGADGEEKNEGMFDDLFGSDDDAEAPKAHKATKKASKKASKKHH